MNVTQATRIAGSIGFPSKMPGTSYGIPARACIIGAKLALIAGTTCSGCYALERNNYRYPSVIKAQNKRLAGIVHPQWVDAMVTLLLRAHGHVDKLGRVYKRRMHNKVHRKVRDAGKHRWHDAGDLQSVAHLAAICEVARRTPQIDHWLPTREIGILMAFVRAGGMVPNNLCIRVSATKVDGAATHVWPTTSTVHEYAEPVGHRCVAPQHGNTCGPCRACWSRDVDNVSYHKH